MFFRAEVQDSGKVANEIDTELTINGLEPNLVDEPSENGDGLFPRILPVERHTQVQDLPAVNLGEIRVQSNAPLFGNI
jgi:hypothetical protein